MKLRKRFGCILVTIILCVSMTGCADKQNKAENDKTYKFKIMTTLFPYYDFAKAVVGENEDIRVELLVSPGQDDHSFEPTPKDIVAINKADLFIYNGGSIENWVEETIDSLDNNHQYRMRMMDFIDRDELESINFAQEKETEQLFAVEEHHHEEEHGHSEIDEHIWTSPVYAQILVKSICDELCSLLPGYSDEFIKNSENYINQIREIDVQFRNIVSKSENKEMIFADKFPLKYFANEYGLKYYAAFPGCSGDTEPGAKTVAFLIDKVKAGKVNGIFYLELSSTAMADVICEDTDVLKYQFNSCHNITMKQFREGVSYIDLMKENVKVLDKALK